MIKIIVENILKLNICVTKIIFGMLLLKLYKLITKLIFLKKIKIDSAKN